MSWFLFLSQAVNFDDAAPNGRGCVEQLQENCLFVFRHESDMKWMKTN